jgi:hypothetical protein
MIKLPNVHAISFFLQTQLNDFQPLSAKSFQLTWDRFSDLFFLNKRERFSKLLKIQGRGHFAIQVVCEVIDATVDSITLRIAILEAVIRP